MTAIDHRVLHLNFDLNSPRLSLSPPRSRVTPIIQPNWNGFLPLRITHTQTYSSISHLQKSYCSAHIHAVDSAQSKCIFLPSLLTGASYARLSQPTETDCDWKIASFETIRAAILNEYAKWLKKLIFFMSCHVMCTIPYYKQYKNSRSIEWIIPYQ